MAENRRATLVLTHEQLNTLGGMVELSVIDMEEQLRGRPMEPAVRRHGEYLLRLWRDLLAEIRGATIPGGG